MEYNPAAPKLPGDPICFGNGEWSTVVVNPSSDLRDRDLPQSAYQERVPKEWEETPAWWDI